MGCGASSMQAEDPSPHKVPSPQSYHHQPQEPTSPAPDTEPPSQQTELQRLEALLQELERINRIEGEDEGSWEIERTLRQLVDIERQQARNREQHETSAGKAPPPPPPPTEAQRQLLCSEPRPAVDVAQRGVTLGYLQRLLSSGAVQSSWTIQQLVDRFVRPRTAAASCCLFDMVPASCTGTPQYFISHTWSNTLADLLSLLVGHFWGPDAAAAGGAAGGGADGIVVWLDVCAINQHPYEARGCLLNDDVASLARVVACTERTLLCLDEHCTSLTRIWCLYEVWQTFLAKGVEGILVLTADADVTRLGSVLAAFDVFQARATQQQDRDRILEQIRGSSVGAAKVNLQLKAAIVDSVVYEAQHTAVRGSALGIVQGKAAAMLYANGQSERAEPMYRLSFEAFARTLGPEHVHTLAAANNLAGCLSDLGRHTEAEDMHRRNLEARRGALGPDHDDTVQSIVGLAACLQQQGRNAEAEPMFRQALEARSRSPGVGAGHPSAILTLNNLAECIRCQGRYAEAEALFHEAVEAWTRALGPEHPSTLFSLSILARCVDAQGRTAEAEAMYRQVLAARTRVLGPDHPHTRSSSDDLAACLKRQGR